MNESFFTEKGACGSYPLIYVPCVIINCSYQSCGSDSWYFGRLRIGSVQAIYGSESKINNHLTNWQLS